MLTIKPPRIDHIDGKMRLTADLVVDGESTPLWFAVDEQLFDVRFDRVSRLEREFLLAMIGTIGREVAISDVAERMGRSQTVFSAVRASLIRKGMVYSSAYGYLSYTVSLFAEYLQRKVGECESVKV